MLIGLLLIIEGEPKTDIYDITVTGSYEEEIDPNKTYTILAKIEHENMDCNMN